MRRMLLLCAVLFVGCAKSEPPASTPAPAAQEQAKPAAPALALADLAGTWDGTVTAAGNDTALVNIELTATATPTDWKMTLANVKTPKKTTVVPATSVVAAGDSVVIEAGPFASVLRAGQQVSTHSVYRLQDGKLVGDIMATYPANGQTLALHSVVTRKAAQ
jgi:hypothetical protein